jgi:hypothetical protein
MKFMWRTDCIDTALRMVKIYWYTAQLWDRAKATGESCTNEVFKSPDRERIALKYGASVIMRTQKTQQTNTTNIR